MARREEPSSGGPPHGRRVTEGPRTPDVGLDEEPGPAGRSNTDAASFRQHVGAAGRREGARGVLLHEQHRHTLPVDAVDHLEDVSTTAGASPRRARPATIAGGPAMSARPIATICCWPPESAPASWRRRARSSGKRREDALQALAPGGPGGGRVTADLEVLLHRHPGEEPPAFRDQGDPPPAHLVRRGPRSTRGSAAGRGAQARARRSR